MVGSIARIKSAAPAPPPAVPPRWSPLVQAALPPLLNALVLLAVGYLVTGQVEQALKLRQATVSSVQAMSALLADMNKAKKEVDRQLIVRRMSMYGVDAIDPLINMAVTQTVPMNLSREGLALIAIRHRREVCDALGQTVAARAHFWSANNQIDLLEILHERLRCTQLSQPWWTFPTASSQPR